MWKETRNIAAACADVDASLIYISTDYVFTGEGDSPFETDAPKGPLNVYGQTKLMGEMVVADVLNRLFIVRTSWGVWPAWTQFCENHAAFGTGTAAAMRGERPELVRQPMRRIWLCCFVICCKRKTMAFTMRQTKAFVPGIRLPKQ